MALNNFIVQMEGGETDVRKCKQSILLLQQWYTQTNSNTIRSRPV